MSDAIIGRDIDGFYWRCEECDWLGIGLGSEDAADGEFARHDKEHHSVVSGAVVCVRLDGLAERIAARVHAGLCDDGTGLNCRCGTRVKNLSEDITESLISLLQSLAVQ